MVLSITGSALQTGMVFLAATLPNLLLGPLAGTFVDRWDQKLVMIVSDLLRAGLVLVIPFLVEANVLLVYPLVFAVTTISLFFRPAKAAILPRIVRREDLMPANGAIWTGETVADIAGYPLAGVFVAFLGTNLALAFWVDSVTYLVSAVLLAGLIVPPVAREVGPRVVGAVAAFTVELREGWHFLRRETALFQNTLVSVLAQLSIGATLALMVVYAERSLDGDTIPYPESYAVIEAAIGLGNLVGGFVVGAIGARLRKGWLVVTGFLVMGLATVVLGLTSNELLAVVAADHHRHLQPRLRHPQPDALRGADAGRPHGPRRGHPLEHRHGRAHGRHGRELRAGRSRRCRTHHRRDRPADRPGSRLRCRAARGPRCLSRASLSRAVTRPAGVEHGARTGRARHRDNRVHSVLPEPAVPRPGPTKGRPQDRRRPTRESHAA